MSPATDAEAETEVPCLSPQSAPGRNPGHRAGWWSQSHAEWVKLRSTRSTWLVFTLVVVSSVTLGALFSAIAAHQWAGGHLHDRVGFDPVRFAQAGCFIAEIALGVLGALAVTAEYSTGLIRATLAAVPRRLPVALAKAAVLGAAVLVIAEATVFAAFLASQAALTAAGGHPLAAGATVLTQVHARTIPVATLASPGVAWAVVRAGLFLTLSALAAFGLGMLLKSTAGTIAVYVSSLLVLPLIASFLPGSIADRVTPYLPSSLGSAMQTATNGTTSYGGPLLGPWAATGFMVLYTAAAVAAGLWALERRDV